MFNLCTAFFALIFPVKTQKYEIFNAILNFCAEFKYQNRGERVTKILNIIPYYLFSITYNIQYAQRRTTGAYHNAHIEVTKICGVK